MPINHQPGVLDGLAVAMAGTLATAIGLPIGLTLLPFDLALRGLITLLGGGYLLYLLLSRRVLAGAPTAVAVWSAGALLIGVLTSAASTALVAHLLLLWLLRAGLYHTRPLAMLADLSLCGASLLFALWAIQRTHSLSAGVWCLLLGQIAFVWLPGVRGASADARGSGGFEPAARAASQALRQLSRGI